MVRKLVLWLMLAAVVGGAAYGYLFYAVVALYDLDTPKVTYMFVIKKPARGTGFFYNHIDRQQTEKEVQRLLRSGLPVPWHMDYEFVELNAVYVMTMDNRNL
ncbi:MAG: hypothetical protein V1816_12970 [Pseudomonadota bacterium]